MKKRRLLLLLLALTVSATAAQPHQSTKKRYRFTAYWKIKDASEGALDKQIECFGELRINSGLQWKILASEAAQYKRKKDETITIFFGTGKNKKAYYETELAWNGMVTVSGFLKNRNQHKADTTLSSFTLPLSPQIAVGQGERVVGSTEKAELRYRLEEVK
jgi:hypothetical protein